MKTYKLFSLSGLYFLTLLCTPEYTSGQANDPRASARSSALYDAQSISGNVSKVGDVLFFTRMAVDRSGEKEIKELANEMVPDFTSVLFSMEQLATAGGNGSSDNVQRSAETQKLYQKLSSLR